MLPFGGRHSAFEIEYEVIFGLNNLAKSPVVISVRLSKLFPVRAVNEMAVGWT